MSDTFNHLPGLVPALSEIGGSETAARPIPILASEEPTANDQQPRSPWALWHPHAGLVVSPNMNFVPRASSVPYRCDDDGKPTSYNAPSLVDDQFMYLLFCPIHAENSGDLFGRLNVSEEALRGKIVRTPYQYHLNPVVINSWERLETALVDVAFNLLKLLPNTLPKLAWPRLPEECGYRHFHRTEKIAISCASRSIKAFRILGAFISFALALHMDSNGDLSYVYGTVRQRSSLNPEASWFDLLAISYISNFSQNFRVGGFIDPYTSRWIPHIEKFVQAGVPVWLLWGPKKREHPPLEQRALAYWPPDHAVDSARIRSLATTTVLLPSYRYDPFAVSKGAPLSTYTDPASSTWSAPSSPAPNAGPASQDDHALSMEETAVTFDGVSAPQMDGLDPLEEHNKAPRADAVAALDEFFANRVRRREARLAIETLDEKQRREQREAHVAKTNCYTKKSTMYMWVEQVDGSYTREQVFSRQFEVEWDNFTPNQRRYTGHLNEWDLCPQYPRYSAEHPKDADSDVDEGSDDEFEAHDPRDESSRVPIFPPSADLPRVEIDGAGRVHHATPTDGDVTARVEVVRFTDFVQYRLGCDLFSGANWKTTIEKGKTIAANKAMMALSFKEESMPAGPEVAESVVQAVITLSKSSSSTFKDLPGSFDHGALNGVRLHCPSLHISLAKAGEKVLFLVHPPGPIDQSPWAIAAIDASTVLQIFRRSWRSIDVIARELAHQGARFNTVKAVVQPWVVAPPLPIRGLGSRPADFQPTITDYNEYLRRREDLLRGPRGRAALMYGGIVARIAREVLDADAVLEGPSVNSVTVGQHGRLLLFDDQLTRDDLDIICGVYYVPSKGAPSSGRQRGDGTHTHLSWWPQASTWEASRCFLRTEWTELAEAFYQKWLDQRRDSVAGTIFGAASWRAKMRKQNKVTGAIDECSERYQSGYLHDYLQTSCVYFRRIRPISLLRRGLNPRSASFIKFAGHRSTPSCDLRKTMGRRIVNIAEHIRASLGFRKRDADVKSTPIEGRSSAPMSDSAAPTTATVVLGEQQHADHAEPPIATPTQSYKNRKRREQRQSAVEAHGHTATQRMVFEHIQLADPVSSALDVETLPATSGGYCGKTLDIPAIDRQRVYTLEELQREYGFQLLEYIENEATPFVDVNGKLFGLRTPGIQTPSYRAVIVDAHRLVERLAEKEEFPSEQIHHRRGEYPSITFGISIGNGQRYPMLLHLGTHANFVKELRNSMSFRRIAGFTDSVFANWAPKLHSHYEGTLQAIEKNAGIKRYFPGSAFAAATVNIGPAVRTFVHRDMKNLGYGWCAITPLGEFDHRKGGHLILWDAKLIVEFPAGSTIFIPSATLSHSNTPIQVGETRSSFTQYTAGGLFRWVDNRFKTDVQLQRNPAVYRRVLAERRRGWIKGLAMLPTIHELTEML